MDYIFVSRSWAILDHKISTVIDLRSQHLVVSVYLGSKSTRYRKKVKSYNNKGWRPKKDAYHRFSGYHNALNDGIDQLPDSCSISDINSLMIKCTEQNAYEKHNIVMKKPWQSEDIQELIVKHRASTGHERKELSKQNFHIIRKRMRAYKDAHTEQILDKFKALKSLDKIHRLPIRYEYSDHIDHQDFANKLVSLFQSASDKIHVDRHVIKRIPPVQLHDFLNAVDTMNKTVDQENKVLEMMIRRWLF